MEKRVPLLKLCEIVELDWNCQLVTTDDEDTCLTSGPIFNVFPSQWVALWIDRGLHCIQIGVVVANKTHNHLIFYDKQPKFVFQKRQ